MAEGRSLSVPAVGESTEKSRSFEWKIAKSFFPGVSVQKASAMFIVLHFGKSMLSSSGVNNQDPLLNGQCVKSRFGNWAPSLDPPGVLCCSRYGS